MHERFRASDPMLVPVFTEDIYVGITYISRQLACDALDEHATPDLRAIGELIAPWLDSAYRPGATTPASLASERAAP